MPFFFKINKKYCYNKGAHLLCCDIKQSGITAIWDTVITVKAVCISCNYGISNSWYEINKFNYSLKWSNDLVVRHWIPNPGILCSKPHSRFKVNPAFHPSEVNKWVPGIFGNLMVKSKLSPRSGSTLEAVETHPWKGAIKVFFNWYNLSVAISIKGFHIFL